MPGKLGDHPHFTEKAGVMFYTGPSEPPTDEEWEQYLATAPDEKTRSEWAAHREVGK